jgi:hypothetical protein
MVADDVATRIGELLLRDGAITQPQLDAALRMQKQYGGRLASALVELGAIDGDVAARALGKQLGVPAALKKHFDVAEAKAIQRVTRKAAEAYQCVPLGFSLKQAKTMVVAFADPKRYDALQEVQLFVGMRVLAAVAPELRIEQALEKFYRIPPKRKRDFVRVDSQAVTLDEDDAFVAVPAAAPSSPPTPYGGVMGTIELTLDPSPPSAGATSSAPPSPMQSLPPLVAEPLEMPIPSSPAPSAPAPSAPAPPAPAPSSAQAKSQPRVVPSLEAPAPPSAAPWGNVRETAASSPHAKRSREGGNSSSPPAAAALAATALAPQVVAPPSTSAPAPASAPPSAGKGKSAVVSTLAYESAPPPTATVDPAPSAPVSAPPTQPSGPAPARSVRVGGGDDREERRAPTHPDRPAVRNSVTPRSRTVLDKTAAVEALQVAGSRDEIGDVLIDHLRAGFGLGIVFITRNDVAVVWKGFAPASEAHSMEALAIALTQPSMLSLAYESHHAFQGKPPQEGEPAHQRMWKAMRTPRPKEAIVVPIIVADRTVNLVYAQAVGAGPLSPRGVSDLEAVCDAAREAYLRLIRQSKPVT